MAFRLIHELFGRCGMRISFWIFVGLAALGETGAFPGVTLEMTLGGGSGSSGHRLQGHFKTARYDVVEVSLAGEAQVQGPWSAGLRVSGGMDGISMGKQTYRGQSSIMPYLSRRWLKFGPLEADIQGGLGWQWYELGYDESGIAPEYRDPNLPPDEFYQSPQFEFGVTQRIFFKVIGLSIQEFVQLSLHSRTFAFRLAIPIGWRPRGG